MRNGLKELPHRHLIRNALCTIVNVYSKNTVDSEYEYEADDEDENSSREAIAVQSMLTLFERRVSNPS